MKITFLLWIQLVPCLAFYFHEGCEVKSEWEIDYKWKPVVIGAWIPHTENSKILSIEIEVGQNILSAYDNLDIFSQKITFKRKREGQSPIVKTLNISPLKLGHWVTFKFAADFHYNFTMISYANEKIRKNGEIKTHESVARMKKYYSKLLNEKTLFQEKVNGTPTKFRVTGDYITLNCREDTRLWNVNNYPVAIPLDDQEAHTFTIFSAKNFEVSLILDERVFPLGWHSGALTMMPSIAEPLPPFQKHLVELHCHSNGKVTCDIKTGTNRDISEKDIQISSIPTSLSIKSETGEFFVLEDISNDPNTVLLDVSSLLLGMEESISSKFQTTDEQICLRVGTFQFLVASTCLVIGIPAVLVLFCCVAAAEKIIDAIKRRSRRKEEKNEVVSTTEEMTMICER